MLPSLPSIIFSGAPNVATAFLNEIEFVAGTAYANWADVVQYQIPESGPATRYSGTTLPRVAYSVRAPAVVMRAR